MTEESTPKLIGAVTVNRSISSHEYGLLVVLAPGECSAALEVRPSRKNDTSGSPYIALTANVDHVETLAQLRDISTHRWVERSGRAQVV